MYTTWLGTEGRRNPPIGDRGGLRGLPPCSWTRLFVWRPLTHPTSILQMQRPGARPGRAITSRSEGLQPVEDLVGPEPLQPMQRLVQGCELVAVDAAYRLHGANVLLI